MKINKSLILNDKNNWLKIIQFNLVIILWGLDEFFARLSTKLSTDFVDKH